MFEGAEKAKFQTYEEIFAARADLYHGAMELAPKARDREFGLILEQAPVEPGMTLIDMPAGGGYLLDYLPKGVHYIAVETAPYFLARCPTGPGTERHLSQLNSLPFEDGSADYAVSMAALHHEPDVSGVFREVCRVLKPGGRFVAADVEAGSPTGIFLNGFVAAHNSMGHDGAFFNAATRAFLGQAGLEILSDRQIDFTWRFSSEDEMGQFAKSLFGLDKATVPTVIQGIGDILGYESDAEGVAMNWRLTYLTATPA